MKFLKKDKDKGDKASLHEMMEDVKAQQSQIVEIVHGDQDESIQRVSVVLSELELRMVKLEAIVERLNNVAETLVEQRYERIRPWYSRVFCP